MNNEQLEQAKIFARNLNYFIAQSGKTQKEVAAALGFHQTTFNTWCVGKIMPGMGKVQRIADYFGIGKSELTEPRGDNFEYLGQVFVPSTDEMAVMVAYRNASPERKESVKLLLGL